MATTFDYLEYRMKLWQLDFYYVFEDFCWILLGIIVLFLFMFTTSHIYSSFGSLLSATSWLFYLFYLVFVVIIVSLILICTVGICVLFCKCANNGWSKWRKAYSKGTGYRTIGIAGVYTDKNSFTANGTFAGTRMLSDNNGDIFVIGTNDGINYWTLRGRYIDGSSTRFMVKETENMYGRYGTFRDGKIYWDNGDQWRKVTKTKDISWNLLTFLKCIIT